MWIIYDGVIKPGNEQARRSSFEWANWYSIVTCSIEATAAASAETRNGGNSAS